jgi:hypothetical protein
MLDIADTFGASSNLVIDDLDGVKVREAIYCFLISSRESTGSEIAFCQITPLEDLRFAATTVLNAGSNAYKFSHGQLVLPASLCHAIAL